MGAKLLVFSAAVAMRALLRLWAPLLVLVLVWLARGDDVRAFNYQRCQGAAQQALVHDELAWRSHPTDGAINQDWFWELQASVEKSCMSAAGYEAEATPFCQNDYIATGMPRVTLKECYHRGVLASVEAQLR